MVYGLGSIFSLSRGRGWTREIEGERETTRTSDKERQCVCVSHAWVQGLGFRVQGLGFWVQVGFRVQGLGFRVQGLGFRVSGLGLSGSFVLVKAERGVGAPSLLLSSCSKNIFCSKRTHSVVREHILQEERGDSVRRNMTHVYLCLSQTAICVCPALLISYSLHDAT